MTAALSGLVCQVEDLKEALQGMFKTAGVKGIPLLFLMTDGQIINDRFLIYINDILANGWINDLFTKVRGRVGITSLFQNNRRLFGGVHSATLKMHP